MIDPVACRAFKSLKTSNIPCLLSHEMLEESLDDAEDEMLDGNEVLQTLDAKGDATELGEVKHLDLVREYSLDGIADEGESVFDDDDALWEHTQYEVTSDRIVTPGDKICGAHAFGFGDDMIR